MSEYNHGYNQIEMFIIILTNKPSISLIYSHFNLMKRNVLSNIEDTLCLTDELRLGFEILQTALMSHFTKLVFY